MGDAPDGPLRWRDVPAGRVYMAFWDHSAPMAAPGVDPEEWDDWCDALRDNVRALPPDLRWLPLFRQEGDGAAG